MTFEKWANYQLCLHSATPRIGATTNFYCCYSNRYETFSSSPSRVKWRVIRILNSVKSSQHKRRSHLSRRGQQHQQKVKERSSIAISEAKQLYKEHGMHTQRYQLIRAWRYLQLSLAHLSRDDNDDATQSEKVPALRPSTVHIGGRRGAKCPHGIGTKTLDRTSKDARRTWIKSCPHCSPFPIIKLSTPLTLISDKKS